MVWGTIAGVASAHVLGVVWYSRYVAGGLWQRTSFPGRSSETISQQAGPAYAVSLLTSALTALLLNFMLLNFFQVKTVQEAVKFAACLASLTTLMDTPHLAFSQRSLIAFLIDHLYDVASLALMAACIFWLH